MAQFTLNKYIEAPREVVFDAALDLHSASKNIRGIEKLEVLSEGPIGLGTRFRETRIMFKKEATEVMEITVFERPSRYAFKAESHGCKYLTNYDLVQEGAGTKLVMVFTAEPQTFFGKVMAIVFSFMVKSCMREMEKDLDDLKAVIEGRTPRAGEASPSAT